MNVRTLNISNSNYIWVKYTGTGVTALNLIDSGAQVSVIPKRLYDSFDEAQRSELRPTTLSIKAGNGSDIKCYGIATVDFEFEDMNFTYDLCVVDDSVKPILGYDFLHHTGDATISPSSHTVKIRGRTLKLVDPGATRVCNKVTLEHTITISAGCEMNTEAMVKGKRSVNGRTSVMEPARTVFYKTGALLSKIVVTPDRNKVPVRLYNPHDEPIRLYKNTTLGILREVDETHVFKLPNEDRMKTEADQPDDVTVTSNESDEEWQTADEEPEEPYANIRKFATLPTDENGDVDYNKMPEHLQQLYEASIEELNAGQRRDLRKLLVDYEDVFARHSKDIGKAEGVKHHIDTGDEPPVSQRPRRQPKAYTGEIQDQIKKLHDAGVIRPSESEWASNVVMAKKKDGSWRMCIDYRELNRKTRNKGTYMLPRIDETLDALSRAKYFCSFDVIQGYHHVELTEESKQKTAFHAPRCNPSHWEYNYMPFGLVGAPRTFQKMMDRILRGLEYKIALAYLDDIIVYGATIEECMANMKIVLGRIRAAGLKLKPSKCSLFQRETTFLGHVISADGIKTDPKKVQDMVDMQPCRNVKDVRTFVGMTQYYSKFIENFQEISAPIQKLMKKNVKFEWGPEQQTAFETLKQKLLSAPILAYPMDDCKYILDTDASNYALGAVLSQLQPDENGTLVERAISYYSKRFNDAEQHYCARRRELLAIIRSVNQFDPYLRGQPFTIRTDHASLRYIKTMKELPSQFQRWVLAMEEYTYEVEIRKGTLHANADGMSRMPCRMKQCICDGVRDMEDAGNVEDSGVAQVILSSIKMTPKYTEEEMATAQSQDPDLRTLYHAKVHANKRPEWNDISGESPATKAYFAEWKRIEVHNKIMYRRWENDDGSEERLQLIIPFKYQRELCTNYHDSSSKAHLGRRRCYAAIQRRYFWHKMNEDIRWWIRTCDVCQRRKRPQPTPRAPMKVYVTGYPNERVSMDVVGPLDPTDQGNLYLLCITDHFSKFAKAYPLPNHTAKTVAETFTARWCDEYGEPMQVHTDQGPEFESRLFKEMLELQGIEKRRTVAFKPSSDGLVERYNKTIVDCISMLRGESRHWDLVVGKCVSAYNSTIHATTNFTPNKLWYGRELFHNADLMMPTKPDHDAPTREEYVKRWEDDMRLAYRVARDVIGRNVKIQKKYYDRACHLIAYKEGDAVMMKDFSPKVRGQRKLADKWNGPFYILDVLSDVNFRVIKCPTSKPKVVHHDRLKRYHFRDAQPDLRWLFQRSKSYQGTHDVITPTEQSSREAGGNPTTSVDSGTGATLGTGRQQQGNNVPLPPSNPDEATATAPPDSTPTAVKRKSASSKKGKPQPRKKKAVQQPDVAEQPKPVQRRKAAVRKKITPAKKSPVVAPKPAQRRKAAAGKKPTPTSMSLPDAEPPPARKRGRPRKTADLPGNVPPGTVEAEVLPKRRGRPPRKVAT